jgi:hypothetical protein
MRLQVWSASAVTDRDKPPSGRRRPAKRWSGGRGGSRSGDYIAAAIGLGGGSRGVLEGTPQNAAKSVGGAVHTPVQRLSTGL